MRVIVLLFLAGCSTVKPTQRAILADPVMQMAAEPQQDEVLVHAIDNREGSKGGTGVTGGGCGCN
jgi:uncharacterized lipoprotein YajG